MVYNASLLFKKHNSLFVGRYAPLHKKLSSLNFVLLHP